MIHQVINKTSLETQDHGKCVHTTIQSAVDHCKSGDVIEIQNGRYEEKVHITTSRLTLIGESREGCVLTYGDYALKTHEDGKNYGTFRSYTCLILADDVSVQHLTIENSAGDGRDVGQAIALFAEGDRLQFSHCNLIGHQDTLFAGPLPEKSVIPGSFIGPTENRTYQQCKQYFYDCMIMGDVDYIFGSALTLFHACRLVSRNRHSPINGYVTAPSTWQSEAYGFVFIACDFTGEDGIQPGTVFLGRPWRAYGQVMLLSCSLDESVHPNCFDPWGNEENKKTARFSAYGCTAPAKIKVENEEPFVVMRTEVPEIDFLAPWHQEMLKYSNNNVQG